MNILYNLIASDAALLLHELDLKVRSCLYLLYIIIEILYYFCMKNSNMNAVRVAVEELRAETIAAAKDQARFEIDKVLETLSKNDWNGNRIDSWTYLRQICRMATRQCQKRFGRYRQRDESCEAHFIEQCVANVNRNFDKYVDKLVSKIGPGVLSAKLEEGTSLWKYSILIVEMQDGQILRYKTQRIWNVSKLGLIFAQFPTRKIN